MVKRNEVTLEVLTKAQRKRSYGKHDAIQMRDTVASKLTREQAEVLMNWCDWQLEAWFEDSKGKELHLQCILDLFHASIVWESLDAWAQEERYSAKTYASILRKNGFKPSVSREWCEATK